ncbi:hypothetical protein CSOJ01_15348 [Colletotrichum sojae]|uniref:Uncharacterized protein n=1 Tax=Colletotrichum sojae TaxID=2175907 RepID=A0A8H6IN44_9PEZI|nr:hypothetical protein CSOJ01_15348 [Colletotrichum sojae]
MAGKSAEFAEHGIRLYLPLAQQWVELPTAGVARSDATAGAEHYRSPLRRRRRHADRHSHLYPTRCSHAVRRDSGVGVASIMSGAGGTTWFPTGRSARHGLARSSWFGNVRVAIQGVLRIHGIVADRRQLSLVLDRSADVVGHQTVL